MEDGFCKICVSKCSWEDHKNMTFQFKVSIKKEKGRAEKLYSAYIDAQSKKSNSEQIIEGLYIELMNIELECVGISAEIISLVNSLNKKALKAGVLDSSDAYIDEMIQIERMERKGGWQARIDSLNRLKQKNKLLHDAYKGEKSVPKFMEYIKKQQEENSKKVQN